MIYLFLVLALVLAVMIVFLLVSNMRISGELRTVLSRIEELEKDSASLGENLRSAKLGLSDTAQRMKSLRSELRAELEGGSGPDDNSLRS